jgi:hypothetical protein
MISLSANHERGRTRVNDLRRLTLLDSHHTLGLPMLRRLDFTGAAN